VPTNEAAIESGEDQRLVASAREGDPAASGILLEKHRPMLAAYLGRRTRNAEDRDDLLQNTMLRAARNITQFRSACPFSQWILRIAANELKNYYERILGRQTGSTEALEESFFEKSQHISDEAGPYALADERAMILELISIARAVCTEPEFSVLMMVYQEETLEEIGRMLHMKGATVRSHFLRGRSKLLCHLLSERPDFVGGVEAIRSAESKAMQADGLSPSERVALRRRDGRSEAFRSACLKVARHLPAPFLMLFGGLAWMTI
jgi:RNA polymerase sigma-70 factor (ECF subfamily)